MGGCLPPNIISLYEYKMMCFPTCTPMNMDVYVICPLAMSPNDTFKMSPMTLCASLYYYIANIKTTFIHISIFSTQIKFNMYFKYVNICLPVSL